MARLRSLLIALRQKLERVRMMIPESICFDERERDNEEIADQVFGPVARKDDRDET